MERVGIDEIDGAQEGDVDGDLNGAPELAGLDASRGWTGVDVLDAMHGRDAEAANAADEMPVAARIAPAP